MIRGRAWPFSTNWRMTIRRRPPRRHPAGSGRSVLCSLSQWGPHSRDEDGPTRAQFDRESDVSSPGPAATWAVDRWSSALACSKRHRLVANPYAAAGAGNIQPRNAAGLPSDAWIRATAAFAWLAFGDTPKFTDFRCRMQESPDIERDPVLQNDIRRLGGARDIILLNVSAEKCDAYVQVTGTIDMKRLSSWIFRHGITMNIFHGVVDRTHADLDAGGAISSILRKTDCSGEVWFRRNELLSATGLGEGASCTLQNASTAVDLSIATLRRLEKAGRLRFIRIGGRTLVCARSLHALAST